VARVGALVIAVVLIVLADDARLGVATAVCLSGSLLLHPAGFALLRRPVLWVLLTLLALPPLLVTTPRDIGLVAGMAVSSAGVRIALAMLARSVVIAVAAAGFVATVSARELTQLFESVGLRGLGFSLGVAMHALPLATRTWATSARALRLRGGFGRHRVGDLALLAMTVIGNALRHADEVVEAAQARGFAADRHQPVAPAGWRGDLVWVVVWALTAAAILGIGG
jgi:energy-coupling factor transporter transmembrane protein EcfT